MAKKESPLNPADARRIRRGLQWQRNLKIQGPGVTFRNTPDGAIANISPVPPASPRSALAETTYVGIIGIETAAGVYQGTEITGLDSGSTSVKINFNSYVGATRGPTWQKVGGSPNAPVNNCLVVNLTELYRGFVWGNDGHLLWNGNTSLGQGNFNPLPPVYMAMGRVMGVTSETTPRKIVYIECAPQIPCFVQITGNSGALGSYYTGQIVQGEFTPGANSNGNCNLNTNITGDGNNANYLTGTNDINLTNSWEWYYGFSAAFTGQRLPVGFVVPAIVNGYSQPPSAICCVPVPAGATTPAAIVTTQTATGTYGTNEETMINNLKTDVTNGLANLNALIASLRAAGFSL